MALTAFVLPLSVLLFCYASKIKAVVYFHTSLTVGRCLNILRVQAYLFWVKTEATISEGQWSWRYDDAKRSFWFSCCFYCYLSFLLRGELLWLPSINCHASIILKQHLLWNHWPKFSHSSSETLAGRGNEELFKEFWSFKNMATQDMAIFQVWLYRKTWKLLLSETTGSIALLFCVHVPVSRLLKEF